jgi:sugar O-acyltransferase (sialic acid O-acetyltransferase NeuD family)
MKKVVIIGASGHGQEIAWYIEAMIRHVRSIEIWGFIDDSKSLQGTVINGLPILGNMNWLEQNLTPNLLVACGIGNPKVRKIIDHRLSLLGIEAMKVIHPSAIISSTAVLAEGVMVAPGSIVTTNVLLGRYVTVNTACTIHHDSVLRAYVNCAPGSNVAGNVVIGEGAHIGTGSQIIQGINIGKWCRIGAGSVCVNDIPSFCTAVGVPAKAIKTQLPVK